MKTPTLLCLLAASIALTTAASAQVYKFVVPLEGNQEVPSGDPDGSGLAVLFIDSGALTIDWSITLENVDLPIFAAHIHNAPAGVNGPVRVNFSGQLSGSDLFDADLAGVLANPSAWYVNVHNAAHPGGAVRGQLTEGYVVPESSTVLGGVGVVALVAGAYWRRRMTR